MYKVKINSKNEDGKKIGTFKYIKPQNSSDNKTELELDQRLNIYDNYDIKILYTKDNDVDPNDLYPSETDILYKLLLHVDDKNSLYVNMKREKEGHHQIKYKSSISYGFKYDNIKYSEVLRFRVIFDLEILKIDPDELYSECILHKASIEEIECKTIRKDDFPECTATIDKSFLNDEEIEYFDKNTHNFKLKLYQDPILDTISIIKITKNNKPHKKSLTNSYYIAPIIKDISILNEKDGTKIEDYQIDELEYILSQINKYQLKWWSKVESDGNLSHYLDVNGNKVKWIDQWWDLDEDSHMHLEINNFDI